MLTYKAVIPLFWTVVLTVIHSIVMSQIPWTSMMPNEIVYRFITIFLSELFVVTYFQRAVGNRGMMKNLFSTSIMLVQINFVSILMVFISIPKWLEMVIAAVSDTLQYHVIFRLIIFFSSQSVVYWPPSLNQLWSKYRFVQSDKQSVYKTSFLVVLTMIATFVLARQGKVESKGYCTKRYRSIFKNMNVPDNEQTPVSKRLYVLFLKLHSLFVRIRYSKSMTLMEHRTVRSIKRIPITREISDKNLFYSPSNTKVRQRIDSYLSIGDQEFREDIISLLENIRRKMNMKISLAGSAAEINIEPKKSFIGDLDFMCQRKCTAEFENGYQRTERSGVENTSRVQTIKVILDQDRVVKSKYQYESSLGSLISFYCENLSNICNVSICGAAVQVENKESTFKIDFVETMRCVNWPMEMRNWEFRKREHDWPDRKTINAIMDGGCDVLITPEQCAYTEVSLLGETSVIRSPNMLISFSRAEITLVNSWTFVQQIVYHILRRFSITELYSSTSSLCNYHIKTLMLWSAENKPAEWWEESSIVIVCCQLLEELGVMLDKNNCPSYFLPDCNLFKLFDRETEYVTRAKVKMFCNRKVFTYWLSNCGIEQEERFRIPKS